MAYNFTNLGDYSAESFAVEDPVSQVVSPDKTDITPNFLGQNELYKVILYFLINHPICNKALTFPASGIKSYLSLSGTLWHSLFGA